MVKKKQQFGGIVIDFINQQKTLEELFGDKPITPADMTKKIWKYGNLGIKYGAGETLMWFDFTHLLADH